MHVTLPSVHFLLVRADFFPWRGLLFDPPYATHGARSIGTSLTQWLEEKLASTHLAFYQLLDQIEVSKRKNKLTSSTKVDNWRQLYLKHHWVRRIWCFSAFLSVLMLALSDARRMPGSTKARCQNQRLS